MLRGSLTSLSSAAARTSDAISEADFFVKAPEYQRWLLEARRTYLDEMSSEEAKRAFRKFVSAWNAGELAADYYATSQEAVPAAQRRHQLAVCLPRRHSRLETLVSSSEE